jgi:AcrR family transcriptional regulator
VSVKREELLDRAIAYVAGNGFSDVSLRQLAAALGTSHRMLIHYFGSKEGLWVEIVRTVEARQRELVASLPADPSLSPGDAIRASWRHFSDPSLWPNERLFFEIYGQALQGREPAVRLLDGIVEDWLAPSVEQSVALGLPVELARAQARLSVAVVRGLLLDLLATREVAEVDAAMEAFISFVEAWVAQAGAAGGAPG